MENNPKTQVIERLKEAQNVLITVSNNPSVDQLSAAIGFTLMMNKLGKHATAVFSGAIPSTIEFLKPEDTLETNTDSLRDFIISLDKAKADKLRYKVEENVVKIFITPYKTSLGEQDLDFSQGDFNVDVVVALGVDQREHIDEAIIAHGRILHDATVIGVMAGEAPLDVGSINWQDPAASSLSEMLVSISEAFQSGLLDSQMATAFLTGIVAETDRFSNEKTSPKVMTMSAQLMAAGANQQLIATELMPEQEAEIAVPADLPALAPEPAEPAPEEPQNPDEGVISLHEPPAPPEEPAEHEPAPEPELSEAEKEAAADQIHIDSQGTLHHADELAEVVNDVQIKSREANLNRGKTLEPLSPEEPQKTQSTYSAYVTEPPKMGGTLTANSEPEALDPSTDPLSAIPQGAFPAPDYSQAATKLTEDVQESTTDEFSSPDPHLGPQVTPDETLADIEKTVGEYTGTEVHQDANPVPDPEAARQAVLDAMTATGNFDPNRPEPLQSIGAQPLSDVDAEKKDTAAPPPSVPPPFPMPDEDGNLPPLL